MFTNEDALAMFKQGFNCSQIVVSHFAPRLGLDQDVALKIASGFGAGMGRMAHICGAVTGAFMVLGLKFGYCDDVSADSKEDIYGRAQKFAEEFKAKHGFIMCRDLLGVDISNPAGYAEAKERSLFRTACPLYVSDAISILAKTINKR